MALLTMNFESSYLRANQEFTMILPDRPQAEEPADYYEQTRDLKVLWLLHGTFGDHSDWVRKTNIERYAVDKGIAVVMPSGQNSNFSNWSGAMLGYDAYDYLIKELMPLVWNWFPVSRRREDNFIAGLSMGGRATIKFAVNHPELFIAAAVLSATPKNFDLLTEEYLASDDIFARRLASMADNAGGLEAFKTSEENVWQIINEKAASGVLPRLRFHTGGDDDYILPDLMTFKEHAEKIGLEAEFIVTAGYGHEWDFWDRAIREALEFFELEDARL
ncbi:S-formylglutathione hydrolase FrmB [Actinomyces ruminicola]|uniref:S-formylglutathione hydrolase FrmB n=1 Tax=Actinomyces ruminicola TaxID=332524 RepID=A0A1H0B960_9ACTO|nr:alpha/beta hydrolase-fold protein [Actinomyces ruminicola]SDN42169.1 S-formylglutathione hydrolase FrmB [Actinomyces ruminicola]